MIDRIDPAFWDYPGVRAALARRDISTVYRLLRDRGGLSQRRISILTGQTQSEVSEILRGRQVVAYDLLVRIADGLGVPHGWLGLAYDESTGAELAPAGEQPPEEDEDVKRRNALALTGAIVFGAPILGPAEPLAEPTAAPALPTVVRRSDVAALRALTKRLRVLGRAGHAGMPDILGPVTASADQLLTVDIDSDATARMLRSALAELHTLAGWCSYDMQLLDNARYHYSQALRLAADADDVIELVSAARHAAWSAVDAGDPDGALKLYQMARFKLGDHDEQAAAQLHVRSAHALALMEQPDGAHRELARADGCPPLDDPFERADSDIIRARTQLALGRVEVAAQYAARSMGTWDPADRRDSAHARITQATIHTIAGEPDAPRLASTALDAVEGLPSRLNRVLLAPLQEALRARKDSASVELARRAREVRTGAQAS